MSPQCRLPYRISVLLLMIACLFSIQPTSLSQAQSAAGYDASFFSALRWRNVGPNRGGRSIVCAGSTGRLNEYYFGAVGGGLWKTTDSGTTWRPVTDGQLKSSSV